jgi:hypothetical protein
LEKRKNLILQQVGYNEKWSLNHWVRKRHFFCFFLFFFFFSFFISLFLSLSFNFGLHRTKGVSLVTKRTQTQNFKYFRSTKGMSAHWPFIFEHQAIQKSPPSKAAVLNLSAVSTNLTRVVHTRDTLPCEYQNSTYHEHGNYT